MALSFPRSMPSAGVSDETFEILRVDHLSPEASGLLGSISAGFPLWMGEWALPTTGQDRADEWRAWISAQRGSSRLFYGCETARPVPLAYQNSNMLALSRAGGGAFDGTATSWSVNGTRDVLTVNGLPAGFIFTWGDYAGFKWTTSSQPRRTLGRAVEGAIANGSGVAVLTIEPPLPGFVPGGAVLNFDRPDCLMKLVPSATKLGNKTRRQSISGQIKALQQLLP
jgi:hypothetical protein